MANLEQLPSYKDMRVVSTKYIPKDDAEVKLLMEKATFTHNDAGEVIYFIDSEAGFDHWETAYGFSEEMVKHAQNAQKLGFNYLCLYWG